MRKKIIAGNWKMNKTPEQAAVWAEELARKLDTSRAEVVLCVPAVDIAPVVAAVKGANISVGAQNVYYEESGAYTGEISAAMLAGAGVKYVIIGHSERRAYFGETDGSVNKKVLKSIEKNLVPIICVGETLEQRERGITIDLIRLQTKIAFYGVPAPEAEKAVIAYEPVWAIGTGKTATKEQAEDVCAAIRTVVSEIYGGGAADKIRIQYGGSVTAQNAAELFVMPDIDGGLVGGASLKSDFIDIVNAVRQF